VDEKVGCFITFNLLYRGTRLLTRFPTI